MTTGPTAKEDEMSNPKTEVNPYSPSTVEHDLFDLTLALNLPDRATSAALHLVALVTRLAPRLLRNRNP